MNAAADLRYGLRSLARRPLLPAAAVVSLALAIGAGTAVFALVDAILLDPLPVAEPGRLVSVFTEDEANAGGPLGGILPVSHPNFEDLRDQSTVFSAFAAFQTVPVTLALDGPVEEVPAQIASASFFDLLGVSAARGRTFDPARSDRAGGDGVAVISHGLWQRRFGGRDQAIGSTLHVNGQPLEVIGVTPAGFSGIGLIPAPELWVPMSLHDRVLAGPFRVYFDERRALLFNTVGRLEPGVSPARARAELTALARRLAEAHPEANRGRSVALLPVIEATIPPDLRGAFVTSGAVLSAAVAAVLLIACLNVANLLLVRAGARSGEIAVRLALGAPRLRLAWQMAAEGLLMALAGGVLGLGVGHLLRGVLWANRPPLLAQSAPDLSFDGRVLGFALLLSLLTGVVFSLAPALAVGRSRALSALGTRGEGGAGGGRGGVRQAIVVGQVALSLVALVGSGLFLGSLARAQRIDPGFAGERLALLTVNLGAQGYDDARGRELLRRVVERLESLPGVDSAAVGANVPLSVFGGMLRSVERPGEAPGAGARGEELVNIDVVGAGYFETLGVPIVQGAGFDDRLREDGVLTAVVNETMARRWWPGGDPIGRRFRFYGDEREREVVGVARDANYLTLGERPIPYIYLPLAQNFWDRPTLFLRARAGDAAAQLASARAELLALDPNLPVIDPTTMPEIVGRSLWAPRLGALLLGVLGLVSLALATVGVYGVMAMAVTSRRRDIGLRMALGADRRRVERLVLRQGMRLVGLGVGLGLLISLVVARFASGVLYGVGATDATTFAIAVLVLGAAAFVANLIPARRATRVDPVTVLRSE